MSALRSLVLVGSIAFLGCASSRAPEPTTPGPVPQLPAGGARTAPARPTRVDHARGPLNGSFALLGSERVTSTRGPAYLASAYAIGFAPPTRNQDYAVALAPTCRTSADCGGGELSCRAREDGVRVCMGLGSPGESCWFGGDCVSGSCELVAGRRACR